VEAVIFFNLEFNYTLRKTTDDNYTWQNTKLTSSGN
jgi:hypothetical protein